MARTKTVIKEVKEEDQPSVVAYRVGQVEKALKDVQTTSTAGFAAVHTKLDEMKSNFVTHDTFTEELGKADKIHTNFEDRITKLEEEKTEREGRRKTWGMIAGALILLATIIEPVIIWYVSTHGGHSSK